MKKFCLILSSKYDFSVDLVIHQLENTGVEYLRINKEHLSDYRISIDPVSKYMRVYGLGIEKEIKNVTSVLFRQAVFLRNTPSDQLSVDEQLSRSQGSAFLRGLMVFDRAVWMNWPANTYAAESKPYQLMIAARVGFMVPETKIGNDAEALKKVFGEIIVKSLDTILLREGNDCLFTYTSNLDKKDLTDGVVSSAPLTCQSYIIPKIDIRVTVVGDQLFSVMILSNGEGINEDWRLLNKESIEYIDITLPQKISNYCFNLVNELGLNFGAIDLIKSEENYYFIEINPTGEWGWLCNKERAIDKCIASLLSKEGEDGD